MSKSDEAVGGVLGVLGCLVGLALTYVHIMGLIEAANDGWTTFLLAFFFIPYGIYRGLIVIF